jgi:hypothetical protein
VTRIRARTADQDFTGVSWHKCSGRRATFRPATNLMWVLCANAGLKMRRRVDKTTAMWWPLAGVRSAVRQFREMRATCGLNGGLGTAIPPGGRSPIR